MIINPIAKIYTDFPTKFGIPRQSRRSEELIGKIVFENEYKDENFIKGIEQFSHLWLIWEFSENTGKKISPTVRPPRLGGNKRLGTFATRSSFRPNSLALSCVKLLNVEKTKSDGTVLVVSGVDMMNKTPIYDIKPYIPYTDSILDANGGFSEKANTHFLDVKIPDNLLKKVKEDKRKALIDVLKDDPRPAYQNDEKRVYGFLFSNYEIKFVVKENELSVINIDIVK